MITSIVVLAAIGILLSAYALYTEYRAKKQKDYKPICDINDQMSCSQAFQSKAGTLFFNIPNPIFGILLYVTLIVVDQLGYPWIVFGLVIAAAAVSLYLATVLIKMKNLCPICTSVYVVNLLLLIFSYLQT